VSSETPNGGERKPAIPRPAKKDPALNIGLRGDRLYGIDGLHKWFAIASLLMFVFTVWMIVDDYSREWKQYQRTFNRIQVQRTVAEGQAALGSIDRAAYDDLLAQRAQAQQQVVQNQEAVNEIRARIDDLNAEHYAANQAFLFARATYDVERYDYEESVASDPEGAEALRQEVNETLGEIEALQGEVESLEIQIAAAEDELAVYTGQLEESETELTALRSEVDRLTNVYNQLDPGFVISSIRNAPVLDMLNPSETIQQVILDKLYYDHPFLQVPRVDRCTTCHLGIDQESAADLEAPFTTHPQLDLFVSSDSPHPIAEFGCTTCHSGLDRAIEFSRAGHTPSSPEQQAEWEAGYGWHADHFLETPMLPLDTIEASCLKCHTGAGDVPAADSLNIGRDLIRTYGCFGCHNIPGYENVRKVGPDLTTIAGKLDEEWVRKWLADPRGFKSESRMPQFWFNSNNSGVINGIDYDARNVAEIPAIAGFLFSRSQADPLPVGARTDGDSARGQQLVESVGCFGCHAVGPIEEDPERTEHRRRFGYNLASQGSKTSIEWLYNWVLDPEAVWHDTNMPSMRLTAAEAADVAAYLSSLRNPEFEAEAFPEMEESALDDVTLEFLRTGSTGIQARERLAQMTIEEKIMMSGEGLVARYGCFGCHIIEGYEDAQPIGTELTTAGSKLIGRFDFGFLDIPHERTGWYEAKLTDPRIFDVDRVKTPEENLRMPNFGFNEDQVGSLVEVITGLVKDEVTPEMRNILDPDVEAGRALVAQRNCRGCHEIEGAGGDIRSTIEDPGLWPPLLNTQGAKTQPMWLHGFLDDPGTAALRPWLSTRMPTFYFTPEEQATIAAYFSAIDGVPYPLIDTSIATPNEFLDVGRELFELNQCQLCHQVGNQTPQGRDAADLAPDLGRAYERLRPQWVLDWILDPASIAPGTTMPALFAGGTTPFPHLDGDAEAQIRAIRDHLFLTVGDGVRATTD
jgi:cbb3-type cytochrome oxidase cytochrome c subunit/predicted  nucleic acid-binding Zn-ribbon protein